MCINKEKHFIHLTGGQNKSLNTNLIFVLASRAVEDKSVKFMTSPRSKHPNSPVTAATNATAASKHLRVMAVGRPGVGTVPDCGSTDPLSPPAAAARADEVSRAATGQSQQSHVAHGRK